MKFPVSALLMALVVATETATAAAAPQARTPIKPISDCIRVDRITNGTSSTGARPSCARGRNVIA